MRRLPLFVLPLVLFPRMVLPLHVFEPRYRRMAARCLEGDRRFGLLYHDADASGPFMLSEGAVGCVAEIRQFRPLPDGRSLMLTVGEERFLVRDGIENEDEYHEAVVEDYADEDNRMRNMVPRRRASLELFARVLQQIHGTPPEDLDTAHDISYLLAETIVVNASWQQRLLEMRSEDQRLDAIDTILRAALEYGRAGPAEA
jgi:ATP-dependent Lon protease